MADSLLATIGSGHLGRVVVARITPGQDLLHALTEIARRENIRSGVILSCVALLDKAVLRNVAVIPEELPITDAHRVWVEKTGPYEVVAMSGYVRLQRGEPSVHAHLVVSGGPDHATAYGGHLAPGCHVFHLAEVIIAEITGVELTADMDETIRMPGLWVKPVAQ